MKKHRSLNFRLQAGKDNMTKKCVDVDKKNDYEVRNHNIS